MNRVKVDWLTLTRQHGPDREEPLRSSSAARSIAIQMWAQLGITDTDLHLQGGRMRYPFIWLDRKSQTTMAISETPWRQGVMFVAGGAATADTALTYRVMERAYEQGWHCTRIDIAADLRDTGVTVQDIYYAHSKEQPKERKKKTFITSARGDTFTLGSRQSNKYLRVYDKAAEQGLSEDWIRVELEYKGDTAPTALKLARNGAHNCVGDLVGFLGKTLTVIDESLKGMFTGNGDPIKAAKKLQTNRERWIRETVFPAWRSWAQEQPGDAWQALYDLLQQVSDIVHE